MSYDPPESEHWTWEQKQDYVLREIESIRAYIAAQPHVRNAPKVNSVADFGGEVACDCCPSTAFTVRRYVCIGGVRHRMEAQCVTCRRVGTWDWTEKRWIS